MRSTPTRSNLVRFMLAGAALCMAAPVSAAEFPPERSAFAYPFGHSLLDLPFALSDLPSRPPEPAKPAVMPQTPPPQPQAATQAAALAAVIPVNGSPQRPPPPPRSALCSAVAFEAANNNLPVRFFSNLIEQESNFRHDVVSHKGARGIAQFMPGTAAERGLADPFDPIPAIGASARLLADLNERFGNLGLAAAAYNAGPQRVADWLTKQGGMPAETQHYVRRITGLAVEDWAKPDSKGRKVQLPPHSDCPQLSWSLPAVVVRMAVIPTAMNARQRKRARFGWWSRTSSLTYVSLR